MNTLKLHHRTKCTIARKVSRSDHRARAEVPSANGSSDDACHGVEIRRERGHQIKSQSGYARPRRLDPARQPGTSRTGTSELIRAFNELDWGSRLRFFRPRGLELDPAHEDIAVIVEAAGSNLDGLIYPKIEDADEVRSIDETLTALGRDARSHSRRHPNRTVDRIGFGGRERLRDRALIKAARGLDLRFV